MQPGYGITFAKLRHFVVVGDTLNLTKAAEKLSLSQPALSRSIISIEQAYGLALFDRRSSGLALTAVGKSVLEEARILLERIRSYDHTLQLLSKGEDGKIALGMAPQLASLLLPSLGIELFGNSSKLRARILVRPTEDLINALRDDKVEFCLIAEEGMSAEGVTFTEISKMDAGFFVRPGHPLSAMANMTADDLAKFTISCGSEITIPSIIASSSSMFVCDNFDILRRLTIETDVIVLCSRAFARKNSSDGELVELILQDVAPIKNAICAAQLEGRSLSPLGQRILKQVTEGLRLREHPAD